MDEVNLQELFQFRFPVLQSCPHHVRGRFRQANRRVLETRHEAVRSRDTVMEERSWKAFCLLPMLLLRRIRGEGAGRQGRIVQEVRSVCGRPLGHFIGRSGGVHSTPNLSEANRAH